MTAEPACVGALVRDRRNRVYAQRRTPTRRVLPGEWDIVGGHVEAGETAEEALARELHEETGWTLRRIEARVADWEWEYGGVVRREFDYLVEVDGDLGSPRLEEGKHDVYAWVGRGDVDLLVQSDGDTRLRDIVAKATRTRLTERLRLEPVGPEHVEDIWALHQHDEVAHWYAGTWSTEDAHRKVAEMHAGWESQGVSKWMAYARGSGELVGRGGLSRQVVDGAERVEVGWTVRPDLWGQGYATEIGRAGLAFAFDDLGAAEVVAFTETGNRRSRAVMERLGMRGPKEIVHQERACVLYRATSAQPT